MFTKHLLAILALAAGASAGCKDCNIAKNGMWDVQCGAFYEESSKIADWTPTLFRRRLEAGDKADLNKFQAIQRQGRIDAGDKTEAADQTSRRLSVCDDSCIYANNGACGDGEAGSVNWYCACGTDCSDCGERASCDYTVTDTYSGCSNSCIHRVDGECDDGQTGATTSLCACGTDCTDCGERSSCDNPTEDDNYITGSTFSTDSDLECMKDVCCAEDEDDCCELNVGLVAGLACGGLVFILCCVALCCFTCTGCPAYKARHKTTQSGIPKGEAPPPAPITLGGVEVDVSQEGVCSPRRVNMVYAPLATWYNTTGKGAALRAKHGPLPANPDAFNKWASMKEVTMAFLDDAGVPPAF